MTTLIISHHIKSKGIGAGGRSVRRSVGDVGCSCLLTYDVIACSRKICILCPSDKNDCMLLSCTAVQSYSCILLYSCTLYRVQ
jgi:hypothetical protein